ncbi:MAG: hypothetical protein IJX39_09305 [Clostridia bacterium]|nr:hypothetical protein [Clostridia bacterium]
MKKSILCLLLALCLCLCVIFVSCDDEPEPTPPPVTDETEKQGEIHTTPSSGGDVNPDMPNEQIDGSTARY